MKTLRKINAIIRLLKLLGIGRETVKINNLKIPNGFNHFDYRVSKDCKNLEESYGEVCVKCGKCGRKFVNVELKVTKI